MTAKLDLFWDTLGIHPAFQGVPYDGKGECPF